MAEDRTVTVLQGGAETAVDAMALNVCAGPDVGAQVVLERERPLSVGASQDNDLALTDPTVSRYHLEVRVAPGGVQVTDLGSLNGTRYANARIERAVLPVDATIEIGGTTLLVSSVRAKPARDEHHAATLPGVICASPSMQRVLATAEKLARTMVSVLIEGETGTGKEVVAHAIHSRSSRAQGPFVVVDCGALPPNLITSELFGHERGAFTGANSRHLGAFERAAGGTLFLDEVGELPVELQPALLGVLERRRFRRVGGESEIASDFRLLSATHRDLRASANCGRFRSDLYFRIAVSRIVIPPLRERPEDVPALIAHFAEQISGQAHPPGLGPQQVESLAVHHWAGNVRELRNFVENALALGFDQMELPQVARPVQETTAYRDARASALSQFEKRYLDDLMSAVHNNASEAARRAQMDRGYLLSLLRRHGMR